MEDDQELKLYTCRFCSKSFTCGRSLGGHMRSHMITNSAETEKPNTNTNTRRKLPNPELGLEPACHSSYGLRENPKKTSRFGDSTNESFSLRGKFCKDCGKEFHSWKALFGHMKCHSKDRIVSDSFEAAAEEEEEEEVEGEEEQKSWISSSSNETNQPNGGSRRQRASAVGHAAASSSFSSVSQIEQEQEEVAMSLMMLSRDVGHWVGGLQSIADSSDNSSVFLDDPSPGRTSLGWKLEEKTSPAWKQKGLEKSGYGSLRMGGKRIKRPKFDRGCKIGGSDIELEKNLASMKCNSRKRKSAHDDSYSPELGVDFESESCKASSHKTSKFECTTCKKVFHSYQALGGHRASHKKTKGCFAWRLEGGENSLGTEASPDPAVEYYSLDQEASNVFSKKKNRGHECQICFKVFSSGQALGGHKRSHLVGGSDVKSSVTIAIQKPASSEIRDLLDLNLPAPVEDESNGDNTIEFRPWWAGSSRTTNMNPLPV